jgi:hypothetical protein
VLRAAGGTETTQENIQDWLELDEGDPGYQLLTYLLTVLSPSWEAAKCATTLELPSILRNPKVHHRVHKNPYHLLTQEEIAAVLFFLFTFISTAIYLFPKICCLLGLYSASLSRMTSIQINPDCRGFTVFKKIHYALLWACIRGAAVLSQYTRETAVISACTRESVVLPQCTMETVVL